MLGRGEGWFGGGNHSCLIAPLGIQLLSYTIKSLKSFLPFHRSSLNDPPHHIVCFLPRGAGRFFLNLCIFLHGRNFLLPSRNFLLHPRNFFLYSKNFLLLFINFYLRAIFLHPLISMFLLKTLPSPQIPPCQLE